MKATIAAVLLLIAQEATAEQSVMIPADPSWAARNAAAARENPPPAAIVAPGGDPQPQPHPTTTPNPNQAKIDAELRANAAIRKAEAAAQVKGAMNAAEPGDMMPRAASPPGEIPFGAGSGKANYKEMAQ